MESLDITADPKAPCGMSYLPIIPDENFEPIAGVSHTRDAIVEMIREYGFRQPMHNIIHQKHEQEVFQSPNGMLVHRDFFSPT